MNREILFRGKRTDNGEWAEGYYFKTPLTDGATTSKPEDGWYFLSGRERHCISKSNCVYEVIPSTVGQYTGLTDKNGKKIFEGDIVCNDEENGTVSYAENEGMFMIEFRSWCTDFDHFYGIEFEVIGNIHDNRELLAVV